MQKTVPVRQKSPRRIVNKQINSKSKFDVDGAYTGVAIKDEREKPVQDADDL